MFKILIIFILISEHTYAQLDLTINFNFLSNDKKNFTAQDLIVSSTPNAFASNIHIPEKKILTSPKIVKIPKITLLQLANPKNQIDVSALANIPPAPTLSRIKDPDIKPVEASTLDLAEISETEYKMIQALIFYELHKKYDVSMSLLIELLKDSAGLKKNAHSIDLQARMLYAESANALGLSKEYRYKILQLMNENLGEFMSTKLAQSILKNIQNFKSSDLKKINKLVTTSNLDISKNDNYLYKLAKHSIAEGNLTLAENSLSGISPTSKLYMDAVLLLASVQYRKGKVDAAIAKLEKLIPDIEAKNKKDLVRNSIIATLARLYFQKAKYKQSYLTYLKIDRSSALWLQSVMEQAWAQILSGDHIGAAGNMFSLHTEVFKKAYLPESYVVRSVGYLNLCQYGDALHVLTDLDRRFKNILEKLTQFQSENTNVQPYYSLAKTWFTNNNQGEINSLPRSFVAELATHPSFTQVQVRINAAEEENSIFDKLISDFSNSEVVIKQNITRLKNEVETLKNQKASPEILARNEIKVLVNNTELQIIKRGTSGLKRARANYSSRLEDEKQELKSEAAQAIKTRYNELVVSLGKLLEQEEILAYEIYSGAGEHIRYQMANGKINDRTPAVLTPEEKKSYKWKFRGEVWEDEIGHYRSSLKNVCASDNIAKLKGDQ